ncbi:hypothetical protein LEP1GSC161_1925 [Leptospira santarosai str. CBC1416]|uniref:Uncharacterized protein n=1 Tax=Leptospira santarosai str. CBC1416 TaxID=1193059 RepID=M6VRN5_9LEPT|nr:hypothetical protein LEP1GSC005_3709 [Leptospira santarosai str. ST188]EMO22327.1 hypothetical protein LEP1GSC168_2508 [Leptospira santarosai str. HAI134]EMO34453.1 hypothetical protein LEP1GSC175_3179 [Leptospira santarosai str. HAI821]EMO57771.1 hypothetical protein LEP1GSC161_1925 [Leptospira santarosai str. CBC1416]EMP04236.1 hypothetical protein LEP1GSC171_1705 [Leptospira santarosai str. HAI1380]
MYGSFQIVHGFFQVQGFSSNKQRDRKKIKKQIPMFPTRFLRSTLGTFIFKMRIFSCSKT